MLELLRMCPLAGGRTPVLLRLLVADNKWEAKVSNEYITKLEARENQRAAVQGEIDKVSAEWQDKMSALEGSTDRISPTLTAITSGCASGSNQPVEQSETDGRCVIDGYAELDERDAKRLIAIGLKGDEWIKALQKTVRAMQQEKEK
ncbi:endopeptidase Rz [Enterobacter phage 01_vB_Eclo_IJM]|nr:endopeptidase Rz [Enterobacter phage 01_vB_Eclo_IJM]